MANPNWKKGVSANPKGRPKGSRDFATELLQAIKTVEKRDKQKLLEYAVSRAMTSDKVLCALLSKLVPDLSFTDIPGLKDMVVKVINYADAKGKPKGDKC